VIADSRKRVLQLGEFWKYVPIEVLPIGYKPIQNRIQVIQLNFRFFQENLKAFTQLKIKEQQNIVSVVFSV